MRLVFAFPGSLETITGGYIYDRKVMAAMRAAGHDVETLPLGDAFPGADRSVYVEAARKLAALDAGLPVIIDGLALGSDPIMAKAAAGRGPLVALVHHPLALETGLSASDAAHLRHTETDALRHADRILVTSHPTAATLLQDYGVTADRLRVALPGNDRPPFAKGSAGPEVRLLSVAAISPRKGFDVLVRALDAVRDLPWHLDLVGNEAVDPVCAAALRQQIAETGLSSRITQWGAMAQSALAARYDAADIFVLASLYEGYGMVFSEALSHGLPVIGTTGGAIPSVVPAEAGLLAEPGDTESLAKALTIMISDSAARASFAAGARKAAAKLPDWPGAATVIVRAAAAALEDWSRR